MKTTVDIPDLDLQDLLTFTKAATKKEAVLTAVREFNRRSRMRDLCRILGTFEDFMTPEELEEARKE